MFASTELDERNRRVEWLFRTLFLLMTLILIVPVALILGVLIHKGSPVISWEFLSTIPREGMTAGGIMPALVGTIWIVTVALCCDWLLPRRSCGFRHGV